MDSQKMKTMAEDTLSRKDIVLRRLAGNGMAEHFSDPSACAHSLFGIQSQVQSYANISLFNRVNGLTMEKLSAWYSDRAVFSQWGQRRTLHIYGEEDYPVVCDLFNSSNYLDKLMEPETRDRLKEIFSKEMQRNGSISRDRIGELVEEHVQEDHLRIPYMEYAIIGWLSNNGVFAGESGNSTIKEFFRPSSSWSKSEDTRERSLEDVLLRYFTSYGPATRQDFCHFSGLTMGETKRAFDSIKDGLNVDIYKGREIYSAGPKKTASVRQLTVLGNYDPLLVAYADKEWLCGPEYKSMIWRSKGIVTGVILNGHDTLGTWKYCTKGNAISVTVEPFSEISKYDCGRIEKRMTQIAEFLGKDLTSVCYSDMTDPR